MDWIPRGWGELQHRVAQWRHEAEDHHQIIAAQTLLRPSVPPPPYYRDLLTLSAILIGEGRPELAVIVAQMACEILVEQTLRPRLKGRKAPWNFNVQNKDVRKLYASLTGDDIEKASFWAHYDAHVVRRHDVVHHGCRVNQTEAQDSLAAATQVVDHVENVRRSLR